MLGDSVQLYQSLDSALWRLGERPRKVVISILYARRIVFTPQKVDVDAIDQVLFELFGVGAKAIMAVAADKAYRNATLGFDDSAITSPVEKIVKFLEARHNNPGEGLHYFR